MSLRDLGRPEMVKLADALERGRMREFEPGGGKMRKPLTAKSVASYVSQRAAQATAEGLNALGDLDMTARQMAASLRLLAEERQSTQRVSDRIQLVWSGPQVAGASARETSVLARELFRSADKSVLVVSYVLDQGAKIDKLFGPLKENLAKNPSLDVKIMVNVPRGYKDTRTSAIILAKFAKDFRTRVWPEGRAPEVYYDPRALEPAGGPRACLHAKCIVVDRERALVTSANFTEAAHARNIEAGVYVTDRRTANDLQKRFESLVDSGDLLLVPGIDPLSKAAKEKVEAPEPMAVQLPIPTNAYGDDWFDEEYVDLVGEEERHVLKAAAAAAPKQAPEVLQDVGAPVYVNLMLAWPAERVGVARGLEEKIRKRLVNDGWRVLDLPSPPQVSDETESVLTFVSDYLGAP